MAEEKEETRRRTAFDRRFERNMKNADSIMSDLNTSIYGNDSDDEVSALRDKFTNIMNTEINSITKGDIADTSSFLNRLYTQDKNRSQFNQILDNELTGMDGGNTANLSRLITDVYKNKILKQADIHEVSSQLVELREAVSTMRDAVVSPDINTGRINREIRFGDSVNSENGDYYTSTIEQVEKKFDLHHIIKDFIAYNTLEQGEYYAYCIPYSEIFNNFMKVKSTYKSSKLYSYQESVEEYQEIKKSFQLNSGKDFDIFLESCCDSFAKANPDTVKGVPKWKNTFKDDITRISERISVVTEPIPLPVIEEGLSSMEKYRETFVNESGDAFCEAKKSGDRMASADTFQRYMKRDSAQEGLYKDSKGKKKKKDSFDDIKDCYIKMMSGRELIPIKIIDEVIGYLNIRSEEDVPIGGIISGQLSYMKFDDNQKEQSIIDDIAGRIVDKFDQKFLKENPKFKKLIVEAINYYDLNERRIHLQFIPKEYIFPFAINKNEFNEGVSMLDGSLFYAKLYLMLLLFKMITILSNSNDQKINYVMSSGIDKNLTNKVQDIIRQKQSRKINVMDLFNYSTLLTKVGNGTEVYIPTGQGQGRPIETEILSGQEVQLNTELMELLRNNYILASGVPSAIMNYLNEADFAKSIETAHSKFNGRVINYQLDLNPSITEFYRAILRWSTNIEESVINEINIVLPAPKTNVNTVTSEMISTFTQESDFLVQLYYGDNIDPGKEQEVINFRRRLARKHLPVINFDELDEMFEENQKESLAETLKPKEEEDLANQIDI